MRWQSAAVDEDELHGTPAVSHDGDDDVDGLPPLDGEVDPSKHDELDDVAHDTGEEEETPGASDLDAATGTAEDDLDHELDIPADQPSLLEKAVVSERESPLFDDPLEETSEGGWLEGSESGGADFDPHFEPFAEAPALRPDAGEEGMEEDPAAALLDHPEGVSWLDVPDDDGPKDSVLPLADESQDWPLLDPVRETLPPPMKPELVSVWLAGPSASPLAGLARTDELLVAVERDHLAILRKGSPWRRVALGTEERDSLVSVAICDGEIFCGTGTMGLFRVEGESLVACNGWTRKTSPGTGTHVAATERRIWVRSGGGLFRSEDHGASWVGPVLMNPVVATALEGDSIAALCASSDALEVAMSSSGGLSWQMQSGPSELTSKPQSSRVSRGSWRIAHHAGMIAVGNEDEASGVFVLLPTDAHWRHVVGVGYATDLRLVVERERSVLYVASNPPTAPSPFVSRVDLESGVVTRVFDLLAEIKSRGLERYTLSDTAHRIEQMATESVEGATELWLATSAGLFRVQLRFGD